VTRREVSILSLIGLVLAWVAFGRHLTFTQALWRLCEATFELSPPYLIALWWGLVTVGLVAAGFVRYRFLVWFGAVALGYLGVGQRLLGWW